MSNIPLLVAVPLCLALLNGCQATGADDLGGPVGPAGDGTTRVTTAQLIRPAGDVLELAGRPIDLCLSPDGKTAFVKDEHGLIVVDTGTWSVRQSLSFGRAGTSMGGLAIAPDSRRVYATTSEDELVEAALGTDGKLSIARKIKLPGPKAKKPPYPCGVALSPDGRTAYVCLSCNNSLATVDLATGKVTSETPVGIAPFAVVLSPDGGRAYVSNWGGRLPAPGQKTALSGGSETAIQEWGGAAGGSVSVIDLHKGEAIAEIDTGLAPAGMALSADGSRLYIANTCSDTVSVMDTALKSVIKQIPVRPDDSLPFGSMPNSVALSPDGTTLYVANAGNNAVAIVNLMQGRSRAAGFVPAGWYPGAVVAGERFVYVANIKGVGSRTPPKKGANYWSAHNVRGTITRFETPDDETLAAYTQRVRQDGRVPQVLKSLERGTSTVKPVPVPVPAKPGEPSLFEHVIYVIKENRTYDQVLGDIGKGNSDPSLCIYGREITPNHHALAEQFVLLDNFYCNGVVSVDGHSWAMEGNVTPYLERSFGGFTRGYSFGDDALVYSPSKFVWDHVLAQGWSFRNYGEFDNADVVPAVGYAEIFRDWKTNPDRFKFPHNIGIENLRRYTNMDYPGWNMEIPDQVRADIFLREFAEFEKSGALPNFVILYLPDDHTSGTSPGKPTPRAYVADNDLALGRVVEAVTHSRFWEKTCIFVMEDDPQDGFDHVDGHRSACLVISPYTKRGEIISDFYSQASVVHTIERIFGATPANQLYAMAPVMTTCFTEARDLTPYTCVPNRVPLAELNPPKASLSPEGRSWADASEAMELGKPDAIVEDSLNRILWYAARGSTPYPAEFAGAHGKGLAALGLKLAERGVEHDDDDDD